MNNWLNYFEIFSIDDDKTRVVHIFMIYLGNCCGCTFDCLLQGNTSSSAVHFGLSKQANPQPRILNIDKFRNLWIKFFVSFQQIDNKKDIFYFSFFPTCLFVKCVYVLGKIPFRSISFRISILNWVDPNEERKGLIRGFFCRILSHFLAKDTVMDMKWHLKVSLPITFEMRLKVANHVRLFLEKIIWEIYMY